MAAQSVAWLLCKLADSCEVTQVSAKRGCVCIDAQFFFFCVNHFQSKG